MNTAEDLIPTALVLSIHFEEDNITDYRDECPIHIENRLIRVGHIS